MRALPALLALAFAVAACGKYGPPVRRERTGAPKAPPVAAAATAADEECADPNTPAPAEAQP